MIVHHYSTIGRSGKTLVYGTGLRSIGSAAR